MTDIETTDKERDQRADDVTKTEGKPETVRDALARVDVRFAQTVYYYLRYLVGFSDRTY